jgi:hypothetical protein
MIPEFNITNIETFEKCSILFEYKEGDQILNRVQPQEYIEYFKF